MLSIKQKRVHVRENGKASWSREVCDCGIKLITMVCIHFTPSFSLIMVGNNALYWNQAGKFKLIDIGRYWQCRKLNTLKETFNFESERKKSEKEQCLICKNMMFSFLLNYYTK